jgi:hypothetical protein
MEDVVEHSFAAAKEVMDAVVDVRLSTKPIPAVIPATYSVVVMEVLVISLMTFRWVTLRRSNVPVVPVSTPMVASGVVKAPTKA